MTKPKLPAALDSRKNKPASAAKKSSPALPRQPKALAAKKVTKAEPAAAAYRLPSSWNIAKVSLQMLWPRRWLFVGIAAVYALTNLILLGGVTAANDLTSVKDILDKQAGNGIGKIGTGIALYTLVAGSTNNQVGNALGNYQLISLIFTSLAIIWTLRQVTIGTLKLRIRDGFYKGMYPLVPAILVLIVIILQLIPFVIGASLYALLTSSSIIIGLFERIVWLIPMLIGLGITMYWLSSSLIAAYIVTLPDMTPLKALRSARGLVRYRRWAVIRRLLFLPVALLLVSLAIMFPVVLTITSAAPWFFFVLSAIGVVIIHSYMYSLYRELLV